MTKSLKSQVRQFLPRSMRPHSILAGPLRGASIYTSWHDYPGAILGTTERPLLEWFSRNVLLRMRDGKGTEIPVSRSQTKRLRDYLRL